MDQGAKCLVESRPVAVVRIRFPIVEPLTPGTGDPDQGLAAAMPQRRHSCGSFATHGAGRRGCRAEYCPTDSEVAIQSVFAEAIKRS